MDGDEYVTGTKNGVGVPADGEDARADASDGDSEGQESDRVVQQLSSAVGTFSPFSSLARSKLAQYRWPFIMARS